MAGSVPPFITTIMTHPEAFVKSCLVWLVALFYLFGCMNRLYYGGGYGRLHRL